MSKNERVVQALNPKRKVTGKTVFESGLTVRHIEENKWNLKCRPIFFVHLAFPPIVYLFFSKAVTLQRAKFQLVSVIIQW